MVGNSGKHILGGYRSEEAAEPDIVGVKEVRSL